MMVGRTIFEEAPELPEVPSAEVVLEVRNLNRGRVIRDVSFQLHKGEILGVAGLVGAGRTEVMRAVFGADPRDSGEILVHGEPVAIKSPDDAVRHGIGYLSEDRKRYGLALPMDVESNVVDGQPVEVHRQARLDPVQGHARQDPRTRRGARDQDAERRASGPRTCPAATSRRWSSPSG